MIRASMKPVNTHGLWSSRQSMTGIEFQFVKKMLSMPRLKYSA